MKKIIFLLLVSVSTFAQSVDYNKIILPDNSQTTDFAERLVQIAWKNNPNNDVYTREVKVADYEVKKSKASWLEAIEVQGNVNEFTLNRRRDLETTANGGLPRSAFYPRYNIRGGVTLGMFFTIPYTTKQNKERLAIAQSQVNARKLELRNLVLSAYNEYVMREKVFRIKTQLVLDTETSHKLVEQKFKNGEITFETYSVSLTTFSDITIAQLEAEKDYKNSKLALEQLIGVKLEDVR
jgi:outer membrane protein TolC